MTRETAGYRNCLSRLSGWHGRRTDGLHGGQWLFQSLFDNFAPGVAAVDEQAGQRGLVVPPIRLAKGRVP